MSDLHPGPAELADDLDKLDLPGCAALVREGHRAGALAIEEAVWGLRANTAPGRVTFAAQVRAWGEGNDDGLARSNEVWRLTNGCETCAGQALRGAQVGCSLCAMNAEVGA